MVAEVHTVGRTGRGKRKSSQSLVYTLHGTLCRRAGVGFACHMPGWNIAHGADQFVSGVEFDHIVLSSHRCLTHWHTVSSCCAAVQHTKPSGQHTILNSSEETSKFSCVTLS